MIDSLAFIPKDVHTFNEQAVREAVIAPLINFLGYAAGTLNNVSYEKELRYPRSYLGKKNLEKDNLLRGKADYVLDAGGRVRWVIEAKRANIQISIDDIEQAFSYANHAEIRAVYFALCNGHDLIVFQTNQGPDVAPIYMIKCSEFESRKQELQNILSADAMARNFPEAILDLGIPLAPGIGSIAKITRGHISYDTCSMDIPYLQQMQVSIIAGNIQRYDDQIVAFMEARAPNRIIQNLLEEMNLTDFEMTTPDMIISQNLEAPTILKMAEKVMRFPAGTDLVNPFNSEIVQLQYDFESTVSATANCVIQGNRLYGRFVHQATVAQQNVHAVSEGDFEVHLQ